MAFSSAQKARLVLGDLSLSPYLQSFSVDSSIAKLDTTTLVSTAEEFIPGLRSGKASLKGLMDSDGSAAGQNQQVFSQLSVTPDDAVSYAALGFALGNRTTSTLAVETAYGSSIDMGSAASWSLEFDADGPLDHGVSLADLAAITVDTNGVGVDGNASTANGGAGFLHVTAYSSLTSVAFKVQHSTDNSSWADLASFTSVTAKTSQRVVVAAGTTVNRYLRSFADVTGSGSVTFAMCFARR